MLLLVDVIVEGSAAALVLVDRLSLHRSPPYLRSSGSSPVEPERSVVRIAG